MRRLFELFKDDVVVERARLRKGSFCVPFAVRNWLSCIIWVLGVLLRKGVHLTMLVLSLMIWLMPMVQLIGVKRIAVAMDRILLMSAVW